MVAVLEKDAWNYCQVDIKMHFAHLYLFSYTVGCFVVKVWHAPTCEVYTCPCMGTCIWPTYGDWEVLPRQLLISF